MPISPYIFRIQYIYICVCVCVVYVCLYIRNIYCSSKYTLFMHAYLTTFPFKKVIDTSGKSY